MTRASKVRAVPGAHVPDLSVVVRGFDDDEIVEYAKAKVRDAARATPRRVLFGRVKLTLEPHRSIERPALVEVMFDVEGRPVRAHVAARDLREAVDLVEQRLRRKLKDLEHETEFLWRFSGIAEPGEWRHGNLPTHRPNYFPRAPEDREIVRRKTFALKEMTPRDAAVQMEALDHDFHLFIDADTHSDAVIWCAPDGGYGLTHTAPEMALREAEERLNVTGDRFVFFLEPATRRGNVLYRRYDGHYGVIAPAAPK